MRSSKKLLLQESEVSEVAWMDYSECLRKVSDHSFQNCIYEDELNMVGKALGIFI